MSRFKEKIITGYSSIDKPWMKYYDDEKIKFGGVSGLTVTNYFYTMIMGYGNSTAINYFGNKIPYDKMKRKIEKVACAYKALGVKKDDRVALLVPTLPETIYSFYALNSLGATACFIDPRSGADRLKNCINAANANILVGVDLVIPRIEKIVDQTSLDKVISLSPFESLPFFLKEISKVKAYFEKRGRLPNDSGYIAWPDFLGDGDDTYVPVVYDKDHAASIVYTSGSTGTPKGVVHTDDAINNLAYQYALSGVPHKVGDKFLNVMPTFLLYGLMCGVHMPLTLGMENIIVPQLNVAEFGKLVLKHQPAHFMVNPEIFRSLKDSMEMVNADLSYMISPGVGGSGISKRDELSFNMFLSSHGSNHVLAKGYGATEGGSALVAVVNNESDKTGSAGIPLPLNTVSIFKYDIDENGELVHTDTELKYGEVGEICNLGPTNMKEYLNNPELTSKSLIKHGDGTIWLHTGDSGYMDEDGHVFVNQRIGRMIITPDSHNIYLGSIENVISKHPAIKQCAVVGITVPDRDKGMLPKAVISLKEGYLDKEEQVVNELIEMCKNELPERDVARFYEVLDILPLSTTLKIDYALLQKESRGNIYNVNVELSSMVDNKILKKIKKNI